eukprot:jgi/Tetstr1/435056/TSEL_024026.t1
MNLKRSQSIAASGVGLEALAAVEAPSTPPSEHFCSSPYPYAPFVQQLTKPPRRHQPPSSPPQQAGFERARPVPTDSFSSAGNYYRSDSATSFTGHLGTEHLELLRSSSGRDTSSSASGDASPMTTEAAPAGATFGLGFLSDLSRLLGDSCLFGWAHSGRPCPGELAGDVGVGGGGGSGNPRPVGPSLKRQHSTGAAEVVRGLDLRGQVAMVTGGTGTLGREVVWALCQAGLHVVLPTCDSAAARCLAADVVAENPGATLSVMHCDLASFTSIHAFVEEFLALQLPLHLLINAASHSRRSGAGEGDSALPEFSDDGYERAFAVGYIGHFMLTELLIPKIRQTAFEEGDQGRIVNVCPVDLTAERPDIPPEDEEGAELYANARQASLSLALHAGELARRFAKEDPSRRHCPLVTINACSPEGCFHTGTSAGFGWHTSGGWAPSACLPALTKSRSGRKQMLSLDAALPPVHLACSQGLRDITGLYFVGTTPAEVWRHCSVAECSNDLYESSLHMAGFAMQGSPRHHVPLSP